MRIAILAGGSRGDYQPVIALAQELVRRGHEVGVTATTDFASWVREHGLTVEEVHVDAMQIYRDGDVSTVMAGTGVAGQVGALRAQAAAMAPELARALIDLWPRYDAIISTALTVGWVAQLAAHDPRPQAVLLFVPALPSRHGDASLFADRDGASLHNLLAGLRGVLPGLAMSAPVTSALAAQGVPRRRSLRALRHTLTVPAVIAHTPQLIAPRRVSGRQIVLTGYPFLDSPAGTALEPELEAFLGDGPPPVYAGFGSQSLRVTRAALGHAIEGALEAGHRVVALRGTGLPEGYDERVHFIDGAPHDLLLPRAAAIIHHGGAGTTAQALRAGVPQVVVPFALDQPFFARRAHEIGVAAAPVPVGATSVQALRRAVLDATQRHERAAEVGALVQQERGVEETCDRLLDGLQRGCRSLGHPAPGRPSTRRDTSLTRYLRADEVRVGLKVLYAGKDDDAGVEDPDLVRAGHILVHRHPGVIQLFCGPGVNHCIVEFVGLEDEAISTVVGFDHHRDGHYPGLLVPSDEEWAQARASGWWGRSGSRRADS